MFKLWNLHTRQFQVCLVVIAISLPLLGGCSRTCEDIHADIKAINAKKNQSISESAKNALEMARLAKEALKKGCQ